MALVNKVTCDMCGCDMRNGWEIASSYKRRVEKAYPGRGHYRFDLCDACFRQLKEACENRRKEQTQ